MFIHNRPQQTGAVLVISLIMLLLLTLIGVTGTQVTGLEEKMAGNMRNRNLAFQAAESALRDGERFLTQATLPNFTTTGAGGLYELTGTPPTARDDWSGFNKITYLPGDPAALGALAANPQYVIQRLPSFGGSGDSLEAGVFTESEMYRVTARGVGGTADAVVVVQSNYKR
ncbi:MAG: pilus assembly protein PilX [Gammaproteobacteria bacterium HGW-Gammaproteobacteria-3]|nr:MAG: pilus assembly protein PilX [Gammaproteobacteria bacterium HGW-Gammaproteobacteria-3]